MVPGVNIDGVEESNGVPHPQQGEVGTHDEWSQEHWCNVGHHMLQRVGVDTGDADRGGPLVVHLVNVFVDLAMVEQSA